MKTYYGIRWPGDNQPYVRSRLTLTQAVSWAERVSKIINAKIEVVRITVSPVKDADIVRCPNEKRCKDGLSCPHGPIRERNGTCEKPKYTGCPVCVPAGKGEG
jgi:hypothetical protein